MKCPKCFKELTNIKLEGIKADCCDKCEGILFKRNKLEKLVLNVFEENRSRIAMFTTIQEKHIETFDSNIKCPKCATVMQSIEYPKGAGVIIDYCKKCKSVWTDKNETQLILRGFNKKESEIINKGNDSEKEFEKFFDFMSCFFTWIN